MSTEKTTLAAQDEQVGTAEDVKKSQTIEPETTEELSAGTSAEDEPESKEPVETSGEEVISEQPAEDSFPERVTSEESASVQPGEANADSGVKGSGIDFSEEEAQASAEAPEFALEGEEESDIPSGQDSVDLAGLNKGQLLDLFAKMLEEKPVQTLRKDVEAIKISFYKLHRAEYEAAKKAFVEGGGVPEEFAPSPDTDEQRLKDLFAEYRKKRDDYMSKLENSKEDNLKAKLQIIEELKQLTNDGETANSTFNQFRELQQRWRDIGPIPQANVKDIWETYNHYVEVFYNYIKINKELRDLDLKKNYEAKIALCEEAEALLLDPSIINAFHKLQKLHDQWRETGPVAKEYKETLWERFREASSRINKQHQEHFEGLKEEQKRNLDMKEELCVRTEELAAGMWTSRMEWDKASNDLIEIQKVWKTIGFAPKKENTKVYERFRAACDSFFENKRGFYQEIKSEMEHNLLVKTELCEAAEAIMNSEDWKKSTDELIALQKKWKETGPVSRRHSDALWKRFRSACDNFFERKSQHFSVKDSEFESNLEKKRALLEEIAQADISAGGFDMIKEFQRRWSEIGFVPIKQKDAIQKQYKAAMDKAFSTLRAAGHADNMNRFRNKIDTMKGGGEKRIIHERDRLFNRMKQLESEIALLENNIGFFANSKNAESMIADVQRKIDKAKEEMAGTIEKIKLIDNKE